MKNWIIPVLAAIGIIGLLFFVFQGKKAHSQATSIVLTWTASGDDGVVGTATSYKMRYSTTRPDTASVSAMDSWWATATVVSGLPLPKIAGSAETFTVVGTFITGQTYYFLMQACDEVPNCSPYSNLAQKFIPDTLPPSKIANLFAQ